MSEGAFADHSRYVVCFLGLQLNPLSLPDLNRLVEFGVRTRRKWIIANHNLHSVFLFHRYAPMREFYNRADWTTIDGMSLIGLGRLYGYPLERRQRVTFADWTPSLIEMAAREDWRVFYIGSREGVAEEGAARLRRLYPTLKMQVHSGYFDAHAGSAENEAVVEQVNAFKPDVLFVGMGMPRQELWIHQNIERLETHVVLPCGASIDYIAGVVSTPPRWAGRIGLEWAFRFLSEPRRLFSRYLLEPWYVLSLVLMDSFRKLRRSIF